MDKTARLIMLLTALSSAALAQGQPAVSGKNVYLGSNITRTYVLNDLMNSPGLLDIARDDMTVIEMPDVVSEVIGPRMNLFSVEVLDNIVLVSAKGNTGSSSLFIRMQNGGFAFFQATIVPGGRGGLKRIQVLNGVYEDPVPASSVQGPVPPLRAEPPLPPERPGGASAPSDGTLMVAAPTPASVARSTPGEQQARVAAAPRLSQPQTVTARAAPVSQVKSSVEGNQTSSVAAAGSRSAQVTAADAPVAVKAGNATSDTGKTVAASVPASEARKPAVVGVNGKPQEGNASQAQKSPQKPAQKSVQKPTMNNGKAVSGGQAAAPTRPAASPQTAVQANGKPATATPKPADTRVTEVLEQRKSGMIVSSSPAERNPKRLPVNMQHGHVGDQVVLTITIANRGKARVLIDPKHLTVMHGRSSVPFKAQVSATEIPAGLTATATITLDRSFQAGQLKTFWTVPAADSVAVLTSTVNVEDNVASR